MVVIWQIFGNSTPVKIGSLKFLKWDNRFLLSSLDFENNKSWKDLSLLDLEEILFLAIKRLFK